MRNHDNKDLFSHQVYMLLKLAEFERNFTSLVASIFSLSYYRLFGFFSIYYAFFFIVDFLEQPFFIYIINNIFQYKPNPNTSELLHECSSNYSNSTHCLQFLVLVRIYKIHMNTTGSVICLHSTILLCSDTSTKGYFGSYQTFFEYCFF